MSNENNIAPINEDLNVVKNEIEEIKQKIYLIRGKQVMLDSDVADLYHYETKRINEAVKRNIERFPEDFCFKLTNQEYFHLKSQIATSNENIVNVMRGGKQKIPYVFTEKGIIMLSGLLKNEIAVDVSIKIVEAFIKMRNFINTNKELLNRVITIENKLDKKITDYDAKFEKIFNELQGETEFKQKIFFDGQVWDSYNLIINIIKNADNKITIIDNYIDDSILNMLSKKKKNVEVTLITSYKSNITKLDVQKFNKEYPILKLAKTDKFHDRFIVIDNKELYHCGASLKDLGKKCLAITKMEELDYIDKFRNIV